jgi:hypothetical protein
MLWCLHLLDHTHSQCYGGDVFIVVLSFAKILTLPIIDVVDEFAEQAK